MTVVGTGEWLSSEHSVVCRFFAVLDALVSPAKATEPFKMLFGGKTRVGPWNHVLDGDAHWHS